MREYETLRRTSIDALRRLSVPVVVLHAMVAAAHGAAHNTLKILMNGWQSAYIFIVIFLLPLVAGYLIWKRARSGYLILFLSMLGALVFGGYYHFVLAGADNVSTVGQHAMRSWAQVFRVSAVLLALVEFAGVVAGVFGLVNRES
jgi:CHASE2 domain-containing sensor protein